MNFKDKHTKTSLSRAELESYFLTKDHALKNDLEKKALNDPFDQDAMDGFEQMELSPSAIMSHIDGNFSHSTFNFTSTIAGVSILSSIVVSALMISLSVKEPVVINPLSIAEKTDIALPDSIAKLTVIEPNNETFIALKSITKKRKQIDTKIISETTTSIEEYVAPIPLKKSEVQSVTETKTSPYAKEIYLHDYKLIDYRKYRSDVSLEVEAIKLTGTAADREDKAQDLDANSIQTSIKIAYHDYIKKTMKYLKEENYKQVLTRCNAILSTYANDLNAQFYAGLAAYNLGEYDTAINHFNFCISTSFSNFEEEAEWLLAHSLLKQGKLEQAKKIFTQIKIRNGYYSKQIPIQ